MSSGLHKCIVQVHAHTLIPSHTDINIDIWQHTRCTTLCTLLTYCHYSCFTLLMYLLFLSTSPRSIFRWKSQPYLWVKQREALTPALTLLSIGVDSFCFSLPPLRRTQNSLALANLDHSALALCLRLSSHVSNYSSWTSLWGHRESGQKNRAQPVPCSSEKPEASIKFAINCVDIATWPFLSLSPRCSSGRKMLRSLSSTVTTHILWMDS